MNITIIFRDRAAGNFEQQEARYPHLQVRNIEKARKYLRPNDLVLDFGCATGIKTLDLAGHMRAIQGIDISPTLQFMKTSELETTIAQSGFTITETISFTPR